MGQFLVTDYASMGGLPIEVGIKGLQPVSILVNSIGIVVKIFSSSADDCTLLGKKFCSTGKSVIMEGIWNY